MRDDVVREARGVEAIVDEPVDPGDGWKPLGLDPWDYLNAVARNDPRTYAPGETGPGALPKLTQLSSMDMLTIELADKVGPKDLDLVTSLAEGPGRRNDMQYTFALHAVFSKAIKKDGDTELARGTLERVRDLFKRSAFDWVVTKREKRRAATELSLLTPPEFFWVTRQLSDLEENDVEIGRWLFGVDEPGPENVFDRVYRTKAAGFARHYAPGLSEDMKRHLVENWRNTMLGRLRVS